MLCVLSAKGGDIVLFQCTHFTAAIFKKIYSFTVRLSMRTNVSVPLCKDCRACVPQISVCVNLPVIIEYNFSNTTKKIDYFVPTKVEN